ncbi:U-box domain-containing protein 2 [Linum grandiflorum]
MPPSSAAVVNPLEPPQSLLDLINGVLSLLLVTSLAVRSYIGRWQIIRSKLISLQSSLSSLSDSSHWSQNPLLHTLLPTLLSTLQRLHALSEQSNDLSSFAGGKLLFQSDLDIASSSLSNHLNDLDLLLRSGVLHQSNAIVLSQPGPGSEKDELVFFIRDLFTRLQIGGVEFKKKALESLLQILNEKSANLVANEGNIGYLISLLDIHHNQQLIRDYAVFAVSILASASDESRKIVFEEGGLGPLLRVLETGSMPLKEKAAIAVEAITADSENGWAVAAYGGVAVLIEACRSGSQATQTHSVGAIRNVAAVDDIKMALAEEGAVPVLVNSLVVGTASAQEKAAHCLAILAASGEYFKSLIVQERGLQRLMQLIQDSSSSSETVEHVLRAITALSGSESESLLSSSTAFVVRLGELIKHGNLTLQQLSASLLAHITASDGNKRAIGSCMGSLVKLMQSPKPAGLQESATLALVSLLSVRTNRKELVREEKSLMRLVQMLDPKYDLVAKKYPVMVVTALLNGGSGGCRKRLLSAGAYPHLQQLTEMEVAGSKKALQRLAGNRLKTIFSRTWRE